MSKPEVISAAEELLRQASGLMLSTGQVQRLRHAFKMERGTWAQRKEATDICSAVRRELTAGTVESVRLEIARGGEVEVLGRGQVRMKNRDGLYSLLGVTNGLTPAQYDAGMAVREGAEARTGDVGSQMGKEGGGAPHDNDRYVQARLQRAKKLAQLGRIERAVAMECRTDPAALQMLRHVAAEGHSLSAFGRGRTFERNLRSLKTALDVADKIIRGTAS